MGAFIPSFYQLFTSLHKSLFEPALGRKRRCPNPEIVTVLPNDFQTKAGIAKDEGFDEALAKIEQLKLKSSDGRFRMTDTANRETLLRIIQSIHRPEQNHSAFG